VQRNTVSELALIANVYKDGYHLYETNNDFCRFTGYLYKKSTELIRTKLLTLRLNPVITTLYYTDYR
jgi:hypothetical protein